MNRNPITLLSFGYLYGVPEADMVIDTRGMVNPFYVKELSELTGLDQPVRDYIWQDADSRAYRDALTETLRLRMALYERWNSPNRKPLTIAVGCTGGRHRSVATALYLAQSLRGWGYEVTLRHRELIQNSHRNL